MSTMVSQITSLTIVYSTVYSGADQRKHQSSASLAFVRGIHRWIPRRKGPVMRKMFPFDDVIMIFLYRIVIHRVQWYDGFAAIMINITPIDFRQTFAKWTCEPIPWMSWTAILCADNRMPTLQLLELHSAGDTMDVGILFAKYFE